MPKPLLAAALLAAMAAPAAASDGLDRLLSQPTAFGFYCGGADGAVVSARTDGRTVTIAYSYPAHEGTRTGRLVGVMEGDAFVGRYDTAAHFGRFRGPIRLTFAPDGTAAGHYGGGAGASGITRHPDS